MCVAWDVVPTRELPNEKSVGLEFMQVNVLKNIKKMANTGGGIRAEKIVRHCQVGDESAVDGREADRQGGKVALT